MIKPKNTFFLIFAIFFYSCWNTNSSNDYSEIKKKVINKDSIFNKNKMKPEVIVEDCHPRGEDEMKFLLTYRYLSNFSEDYLIFFSKQELRILRNSIFAYKGYRFKSEDLEIYFKNQTWYCPKYDNVDSLLTETERENIAFILATEKNYEPENTNKLDYFIDLFAPRKDIFTPFKVIPLYYLKNYIPRKIPTGLLADFYQSQYLYTSMFDFNVARKLIINNDNYLTFIFSTHDGSNTPGLFYLCSIDLKGNTIDSRVISDMSSIDDGRKIRSVFTIPDSDPPYSRLDTIGIYNFIIEVDGKIISEKVK